jgi:hypothetical protein
MSTHEMQWKADIEAKLSQLTAQNTALANQLKAQPSLGEVLQVITAQLSRMDQGLREDFIGKFAGMISPATESITNRVVKLEERLSTAEEREQKFEEQSIAHQMIITEQFERAENRLIDILNAFVLNLEEHHRCNAETLKAQQAAAKDCRTAAAQTAQAASLCTTFAQNYESTASQATGAIRTLTGTMQSELRSLVRDIEEKASATIMPVVKKAREMTEDQYIKRAWWIAFGAIAILLISGVLTRYMQPSPYIMRDAASWRSLENGMRQEQADKINKVLNEVQAEQRAEEEKQNK